MVRSFMRCMTSVMAWLHSASEEEGLRAQIARECMSEQI